MTEASRTGMLKQPIQKLRSIHWFSPLPPARSGIAEVAAFVAPALSRMSRLTLWSPQPSWSSDIERSAPVMHIHDSASASDAASGVRVYNLGNNYRYHGSLWRAAMRKPGVVILHDLYLPGLFCTEMLSSRELDRALTLTGMDRAALERAGRWHGQGPSSDAQRTFLRLATAGALGVVVHTDEGMHAVQAIGRAALRAHLPYAEQSAAAPRAAGQYERPAALRKAPSTSSADPLQLVIFGHLGPNRRLSSILQALSCMPERARFRLHIFGETHAAGQLRGVVRAAGLSRIVEFHGFVSDEELDAALATADLGINLRYPSMGECSLSQLRLWSHQTPSVVTREGWYGELGEDLVEYVRPDHEIDDLQAVLRALLQERQPFERKARCGRERLLALHSPQKYLSDLLQLIESVVPSEEATGSTS